MITYIHGDMFYSPARVLVNPVNTVGAMGTGLAYEFKRFFPEMYDTYRDICENDRLSTGQLLLYKTPHKWVLNFPTKNHFRAASRLEYLEEGLKKFVHVYADQHITSVSFPALGTGSGQLDWNDVRPLMESYLAPLPIPVFIHHYSAATPFADTTRNTRALRRWLNELPQIVSFEFFWKAVLKVIRAGSQMHTLESQMDFKAIAIEARGRQRLSLKISPRRSDSIFVPETQLRDLWHYVRRAGYVLPQNLPAGLEAHSEYVIALLTQLPFIRPVQLAPADTDPVIGLHYIPPVEQNPSARQIDLGAR